jgi:transcriptional regulator with XRE-family HTH domain
VAEEAKVKDRYGDDQSLSSRTVSNLERGSSERPSLATLHVILNALDKFAPVLIEDKNIVLNAYGYHSILEHPTPEEVERICSEWQGDYSNLKLPAYLISFSQQLLAWNSFAPLILGIKHDSPKLKSFSGITIFDLAFNPEFIGTSHLENGEEFFPKMIRTIKAELQSFRYESWYDDLITQTGQKYPLFKVLWESLPDDLPPINVREHGPVHVRHPNGKLLKFQLVGIDYAGDPRFRVVQYQPIDSITLTEWNTWVEQEGE